MGRRTLDHTKLTLAWARRSCISASRLTSASFSRAMRSASACCFSRARTASSSFLRAAASSLAAMSTTVRECAGIWYLLLVPELVALCRWRCTLRLVRVGVRRCDWRGCVGSIFGVGLFLVHAVVGTGALCHELLDRLNVEISLGACVQRHVRALCTVRPAK